MFKPYGFDYDEQGNVVGYKGHPIRAFATCEKHGKYPAVYVDSDGSLKPINGKLCPFCHAVELFRKEMKTALIPTRFIEKTLDNFQATTEWQAKAKAKVKHYIDNLEQFADQGRSLIFLGNVGTGKTHLAVSLLKAFLQKGGSGVFLSVSDLILDIRDSWGKGSAREKIELYASADLLVLDEVGVQAGTDNERQILFSIINRRYNEVKPTVLISNLDIHAFKTFVGKRIFDRLKENGGDLVAFTGESYR